MHDTDLGFYRPLLKSLENMHSRYAVIGGHATGLWANHYGVIKTILTSKDLDLRGQEDVAYMVSNIVDGKIMVWNKKETKQPYFWAIRHKEDPAIEVTSEIPLAEDEKVYAFKVKADNLDFRVSVSDPLTLLCAKIETAVNTLEDNRTGKRKDFLHLKYLAQCIEPFFKELEERKWEIPTATEAKACLLRRLERRIDKISITPEITTPIRFMLQQCFTIEELPPALQAWANKVAVVTPTDLLHQADTEAAHHQETPIPVGEQEQSESKQVDGPGLGR